MRTGTILIACSLVAAPALALAQDDLPRPNAPGSPGMPGGDIRPDPGGSQMNTGRNAAPLPHRDREFIDKAAMSSMFELKLSQLALGKTQNATVKEFAQHMIDDHGKVNDKLKQIAQTKSVSLPNQFDSRMQAEYDRISKLEGPEFDRSYMKVMVDDHGATISEFQKEADEGKDADLKSFARQTLPTLKQHNELAKRDRRML